MVGGEVLQGANGAAGEIGYSLRGRCETTGAAAGHAPLEEFAGGRAIGERASELLGTPVTRRRGLRASRIRARASCSTRRWTSSPSRWPTWRSCSTRRGSPSGGGLMSQAGRVLAALERRLSAAGPFPPELVPAAFVHDGPLRGAIALALDEAAA